MNARGIPAQSEPENLEKVYSYTLNEMTGEKVPFGGQAKHPVAPPSGDQASATGDREGKQQRQQPRREKSE